MPPVSQLPGLVGTRDVEKCSPTLGRFWLPMTEKVTRFGVTFVGLYRLRQQGRAGSGLWVQPLPLGASLIILAFAF